MAGFALALAGVAIGALAWLECIDKLADANRQLVDVASKLSQARISAIAERSIASDQRKNNSPLISRLVLERTTTNKLVIDARLDRAAGSESRDRATFRVKGDYSQLKELLSGLHAADSGLRLLSLRLSRIDATAEAQLTGEVVLELQQ